MNAALRDPRVWELPLYEVVCLSLFGMVAPALFSQKAEHGSDRPQTRSPADVVLVVDELYGSTLHVGLNSVHAPIMVPSTQFVRGSGVWID